MLVLGVDPGFSGALCLYDTSGSLVVEDVPVLASRGGKSSKREMNGSETARILDNWAALGVAAAFIEKVGTMPGQGISSAGVFLECAGRLRGVIEAHFIPVYLPTPQTWKKHFGLGASKDASRAKATQLFPRYSHLFARVRDDGRSEAALIALYGSRQLEANKL